MDLSAKVLGKLTPHFAELQQLMADREQHWQ
jgi:hypothetical protein